MLTQELFSELQETIDKSVHNEMLRALNLRIYREAFFEIVNFLERNGIEMFVESGESWTKLSPIFVSAIQYLDSRMSPMR